MDVVDSKKVLVFKKEKEKGLMKEKQSLMIFIAMRKLIVPFLPDIFSTKADYIFFTMFSPIQEFFNKFVCRC